MDAAQHDVCLSPFLTVPAHPFAVPLNRPCEWCCSWSLPLSPYYANRKTEHHVALTYAEWLAWHWHVITHQHGVPLS